MFRLTVFILIYSKLQPESTSRTQYIHNKKRRRHMSIVKQWITMREHTLFLTYYV